MGVTTLLLVAGCGGDDSAARSVVVVTPDEVAEIVIIGEIEKPESVVEAPVVDAAPTTVVVEGGGDEEEGAVVVDGGVAEVVSVKPTVPLTAAEDDPLEGLADSFGDFIDCMLLKGFDLGDPADPSFTQKIMDGVLNDEAFSTLSKSVVNPAGSWKPKRSSWRLTVI